MRTLAAFIPLLLLMASCEEEQTFRTVKFNLNTDPGTGYRINLLMPPNPALLADSGLLGNRTVDFEAEMGDTVIYDILTKSNKLIHSELLVNDELVLVNDMDGIAVGLVDDVRHLHCIYVIQ